MNLTEQYEGDVVVMEVVQDASSAQYLESWSLGYDYNLFRTSPANQIQSQYPGFLGYPTLPLIDLETMEVVDVDCYFSASWQACIDAHL